MKAATEAVKGLAVDDFVAAVAEARDADTRVSDIGADLLADGTASLSELARAIGVTRQSVTERVAVVPSWKEVTRAWSRVAAWYPDAETLRARVSTSGRFVVFAMDTPMQEGGKLAPTVWRVLRHTTQPADAEQLADYLQREGDGVFRFIRRPADLDASNVLPWRLP